MGLDMYMQCNDRELTYEVQEEKWKARRGTIIYWRKANAIHNWIIENAEYSDHEDDCKDIVLTVNDLRELQRACRAVIENNELAPELLPTKDGFFFGSTEYDDWYFDDVKFTEDRLSKILDLVQPAKKIKSIDGEYGGITFSDDYIYKHNDWILQFTYQSSW